MTSRLSLAAVATGLLLLPGCGGGASSDRAEGAGSQATQTTRPAQAASPPAAQTHAPPPSSPAKPRKGRGHSRPQNPPASPKPNAPARKFCATHRCAPGFDSGSGPIVRCASGEWTRTGCPDGGTPSTAPGGTLVQCNDGRWIKVGSSPNPCARDGGDSGTHYP
jgi:hypothetical protein